jgi:Domain of unknown function (DUF4331)
LKNGGRVFAGQRDETFYIDLGATFDTLHFRAPPILSPEDDADDFKNPFGNDMFSGFNVNTIALEVPISELSEVIGLYASTSRPKKEIHKSNGRIEGEGDFVQVARMGNPLVNELIIGTGMKDRWNARDPKEESSSWISISIRDWSRSSISRSAAIFPPPIAPIWWLLSSNIPAKTPPAAATPTAVPSYCA